MPHSSFWHRLIILISRVCRVKCSPRTPSSIPARAASAALRAKRLNGSRRNGSCGSDVHAHQYPFVAAQPDINEYNRIKTFTRPWGATSGRAAAACAGWAARRDPRHVYPLRQARLAAADWRPRDEARGEPRAAGSYAGPASLRCPRPHDELPRSPTRPRGAQLKQQHDGAKLGPTYTLVHPCSMSVKPSING